MWEITLNDIFDFTNACIQIFAGAVEEIVSYIWPVIKTLFWLSIPIWLALIGVLIVNFMFHKLFGMPIWGL